MSKIISDDDIKIALELTDKIRKFANNITVEEFMGMDPVLLPLVEECRNMIENRPHFKEPSNYIVPMWLQYEKEQESIMMSWQEGFLKMT